MPDECIIAQVKPRSTAIGRHPIICQSVPINDDAGGGGDCNGLPGTQAYAPSGTHSIEALKPSNLFTECQKLK